MNSGGFTTIDLIILIVYLLAVLFAGLFFSKREMQGKEFFKGDGSIPWYVTSVSIFATLLSPISFMSLAGNSYAGTWIMWFAQLGMLVAIPIAIRFFLPIYARLDIDTAYDYLDKRFDSKILRIIGAALFIIYQVGRMSIIMYLPSAALALLTGINVNILIILMGAVAIVYSFTGGIKSVLWTDFIQGSVLLVGVTLSLFFLIHDLDGGFGTIVNHLTADKFLGPDEVLFDPNLLHTSVFLLVVGAGFNTLSSYISSQDIVQRFTTTQDIKKLNKMMFTNGALSIFIATVFYLIGTGLYAYYQIQNPSDPGAQMPQDQIFTYFIAYRLPVGITGVLLAAIYAASQSTLSTGLNSVATSWTLDIQDLLTEDLDDAKRTWIARWVSLGVGIFSIVISIILAHSEIVSAYEWFNSFMGLVLGVLGGVFILGAFSKRANKYGAYAALIVSSIVMICVKYVLPADTVSIWAYSLISIAVSLVVGYLVSLVFKTDQAQAPKYTTVYDIPEIKENADWMVRH
ncbi:MULTISPECIES: sodium:solute symporter [Aerococcus]|uniref:Sodium/solute symporter n=1 Tax=Aerococcus sanguinicola TaxID=119206 RepID=A0A5N1GH67_9LACT|nr:MULTISPECIES: sodium:solute symporter [Aerococcus]KAA9300142.1 sodium/solute symporter [Aerococcus sanguinicola]MDK6369484.1 sodium:solute symporter [Aerococcus sp. UMB9870]MDK6679971.1 sodium:solute symporter [Aerococcus sp. UMB8608]MDK6686147.1 sodium:solute symporter [Aerococcus sp. UMB8623]MDK6939927.1 sodium:solute symporter [Aerococcus sp. UMB8487]